MPLQWKLLTTVRNPVIDHIEIKTNKISSVITFCPYPGCPAKRRQLIKPKPPGPVGGDAFIISTQQVNLCSFKALKKQDPLSRLLQVAFLIIP